MNLRTRGAAAAPRRGRLGPARPQHGHLGVGSRKVGEEGLLAVRVALDVGPQLGVVGKHVVGGDAWRRGGRGQSEVGATWQSGTAGSRVLPEAGGAEWGGHAVHRLPTHVLRHLVALVRPGRRQQRPEVGVVKGDRVAVPLAAQLQGTQEAPGSSSSAALVVPWVDFELAANSVQNWVREGWMAGLTTLPCSAGVAALLCVSAGTSDTHAPRAAASPYPRHAAPTLRQDPTVCDPESTTSSCALSPLPAKLAICCSAVASCAGMRPSGSGPAASRRPTGTCRGVEGGRGRGLTLWNRSPPRTERRARLTKACRNRTCSRPAAALPASALPAPVSPARR